MVILRGMLLDIGVGILLGILFDSFTEGIALSTLVIFGAFSALSPDIDFVFHIFKGGRFQNAERHRELLHNPLIFVPIGAGITYLFEPQLAGLFAAGALSHMIHDSIGIGWGVRWLWPFRNNNYALGYRVRTGNHAKLPRQAFFVWPNDEIDKLSKDYGDPEWFRNTYIKWHPFAIFELAVFVLSLIVLYFYAN